MSGREQERIESTQALLKLGRSPEWLAVHSEKDQTLIAGTPGDTVGYVLRTLDEAGGKAWLGVVTKDGLRVVSLTVEQIPGWSS